MIPIKIQLKNFLSYGPSLQTIDFSDHTLICLSGKNGHGKSALLDAMTWAIWGQARKVSGITKPDQGLLRLGQTQMLVIFDFEFNKKIYRVRREYMETYGKPLNNLEFGIIETQTAEFISLTDKTIRTTQEKIEQTLRLDFESFINSAFLRQGNSNEFSKKSPKERKHILATILGLDQYEIIRKLAQEKIKEFTTNKLILTTLQEKKQQELIKKEELTSALKMLNEEITFLNEEEKKQKEQYALLDKKKHIFDQKQQQYALLQFQQKQFITLEETEQQKLRKILHQWRLINKQKKTYISLAEFEKEKKNLTKESLKLQNLFQQNLEDKENLLNITQKLHIIIQQYKDEQADKQQTLLLELERLLTEQKNHQQLAETYTEQIQQYSQEHATLLTRIQELQATIPHALLSDVIAKQEISLEKRKAAYHRFVSLGNWINEEIITSGNKKKLVHNDNPSCPLCEQNLSAARKRFLKTKFDKNESFLLHRFNRLKRIVPTLKETLIAQNAQITQYKEELLHKTTITTKITDLTQGADKIVLLQEQAKTSLAKQQATLNSYDATIAKQKKIINELTTLIPVDDEQYKNLLHDKEELEKKLRNNAYDATHYNTIQQKLLQLENQQNEHEILLKEINQQQYRREEIHSLCVSLKKLAREKKNIQQKIALLSDLTTEEYEIQQQKEFFENNNKIIQEKKNVLIQEQGSIKNQQKHLLNLEKEYNEEKVVINKIDQLIDDYQTISLATGKDGIQALLIEDVIPEIEQEANFLLARLTNNQAQIFIESLRDLKKGGTKETLDIKISDQNGIRPYELFSGGEAFRIDFALRIALSKLLARRAGTALQTLIIDEGFGSQDEEGLSHIMDALHKIQDIFSKIIVVSHLPTMKDQFPTQFIVEKGIQGSTIKIVELG